MSDQAPLTLDELRVLLRFIPADSRETWVAVGMGIHAEFGQEGFEEWDTWSQSGTGYKPADCKTVWRGFKRTAGGVGIGSVVQLAQQGGWERDKRELSAADKRRLNAEHEARRKAREAEVQADEARLSRMRGAVAEACRAIWDSHAVDASENAYCARKGVGLFGVRVARHAVALEIDDQAERCQVWAGADAQRWLKAVPYPRPAHLSMLVAKKGDLLVPLRDAEGTLWALQVISAAGKKLFPKYGRKSGLFHLLGDSVGETLAGAEGYATAASVHMATGWPVAVAFDSGNLPKVAETLRRLYPSALLVIAGDDDVENPDNPGRAKAEAAALAVGGVLALPAGANGKDWNDLHAAEGLQAVRVALETAALAGPLVSVALVVAEDLPPAPSAGEPAAAAAAPDEGGGEGIPEAERIFRRFALVEGETKVFDFHKRVVIKKTAFELLVTKALAKAWMERTDKKVIGADDAKRWAEAAKQDSKAKQLPGTAPVDRYVYIDGTKEVWDRDRRRRIPEGALKMAVGDAFPLWLNSPERKVVDVDQIVFDPAMRMDPSVYINTFEGLPLEPLDEPGRCRELVRLLKFLCNGDEEAAHWLTCWLAFPLQNMGTKLDTAVLFHSTMEGSGKSLLFSVVMGQIYGRYSSTLGQTQLESSWTTWQSQNLYSVFEEVVSRDQRFNQVGKIKQMITGATARIESKFLNGWEEANYMNAVFLSNEIMPWPISKDDRRFFVMWPVETLDPVSQARIKAELEAGGAAAFYHYLLTYDTGDFHERTRPPHTPARQRLVELSRAGWETFLAQWKAGWLDVPFDVARTQDIHDLYLEWCTRGHEKSPLSDTKLSLFLSTEIDKTSTQLWWYDDTGVRRRSIFFFPSPPPNLRPSDGQAMGKLVKRFRDRAYASGWSVDKWQKCIGWVAPPREGLDERLRKQEREGERNVPTV